jgi:hypothetical protein
LKFAVTSACIKTLVFCAALATGAHALAQSTPAPLQNWFNDPFFQFTSVVTDCPEPLGPRINAEDRASQAHRRAEKGTSCWLAGTCDKPNAYAYDADIAVALKSLLQKPQLYTHSPLVNSSLWATVQGRIVTIEGCVAGDVPGGYDRALITKQIEAMVSGIPNVLQAVALIRTGAQARAGERVPYRVRP